MERGREEPSGSSLRFLAASRRRQTAPDRGDGPRRRTAAFGRPLEPPQVLVAPPRDVDDRELARAREALHRIGDGVGALDRRDDSLQARKLPEGLDRLVVHHGRVGDATRLLEVGVLGADARVVEPR